MPTSAQSANKPPTSGRDSGWRNLVRVAVALAAFGYATYRAYGEARALPVLDLAAVRNLLAAGLVYLAGLLCCVLYWLALIANAGGKPKQLSVVVAYFVGHLAKYLPGKVWVIVVRSAWPEGAGLTAGMLAMTATQETLLMMGIGGLLGGGLWFATAPGYHATAFASALVAVGAGLAMTLVASPALLPLLRCLPGLGRLADLSVRSVGTFLRGVAWMVCCWLLLGLSLKLVYVALGIGAPGLVACVAATAIATSVGFVSMLPGGLGSRELVLTAVLDGYSIGGAALAAAVMRLVWLGMELGGSLLFWGLARVLAGHAATRSEAAIDTPRR